MYISGMTVQKKRPTLKLSSHKLESKPIQASKTEQEQRPYSSEQKLIELHNHYSVGPSRQRNPDLRHLSQNKISIKKTSEKRISNNHHRVDHTQLDAQEKVKDSYALSIKPKLSKRPASDANTAAIARISEEEMIKMTAYFRCLPVSILSSLNIKEAFMVSLSETLDIKAFNPFKKPSTKKDITEQLSRLLKQAQLKGKYKYREKFNYTLCAQLKALQYKRREFKKKKQSDSSSESDDDKTEKCRDMDTWKKTMGIDGKVFIIKGKYPDLRNALQERGWVQNTDKKSNFFDLKWTTKISDINFNNLKTNQAVNHFDNNACLTSKYGLLKSIRSVMYPQNMDIDKFFPKAYDLSDLGDFQNFLEVFKWIHCESILKKYTLGQCQAPINKIKLALVITQRRLTSIENVLRSLNNNTYQFCTPNQWNYLHDCECDEEEVEKTISMVSTDNINNLLQNAMDRLQQHEPQFKLNGHRGIWIAKPAFLSRGRGIKCLANLNDILDTCLGKQTQYVVQKYIQNPLIINKRKFDIRVWVVIEDYNPPKIWFYNQFYLRFCLEDYDTGMLKNKYAHLTNNSIQKYNTKIGNNELNTSMWDRATFEKCISDSYGEDKFKTMLAKMKEIVIATILGTIDQVHGRRGSFEQLGYDMMIDEDLNPWLIEVNSSPAMDYSTPITRKLVKAVMEDIAKIIVDLRRKKSKTKSAGEFKLIYSGEKEFKNKYYRMCIGEANNQ